MSQPGTNRIPSAVNAALANEMTAHADEADDTHFGSRSHLGGWHRSRRSFWKHELTIDNIASITINMSDKEAHAVDNRKAKLLIRSCLDYRNVRRR